MQIHSVLKRNGAIVGFETSDSRGRHFHVGQPPAPLRTSQAAPSARCEDCGRYRGMGNDPCGNCGSIPTPQPAAPVTPAPIPMPVPSTPWYRHHAAAEPTIGEQLDQAIAARATGRVGNFGPPPTPAPVAPPCPKVLLTFGTKGSMLDAVVARQRETGLRPPDIHAAMRTMEAQPCTRCHRTACGCPPPPPATLDQVVHRQAARLTQMEAAAVDAGMQAITKTVGMSGTA